MSATSIYAATTTKPDCKQVIEKADKAIEEKNKQLELADLAIKDCLKHGTTVQLENNKLREENSSIWRNPFFMVLLGVTAATAGYLILGR